jgi:IS5 family transposase
MMKMLVLQSWYGLSDPELERQANDRISFHKFLGFPERIPDRSTVWAFRERLIYTGKDEIIWEELQRQIDAKGLKIKEGVIQDATFITADPGHKKVDKPRGPEAKTRRNKEGEWTKKGGKSHYGNRIHSKMDIDHGLIREIETTPASIHDTQIDLSKLFYFRIHLYYPLKNSMVNSSSFMNLSLGLYPNDFAALISASECLMSPGLGSTYSG